MTTLLVAVAADWYESLLREHLGAETIPTTITSSEGSRSDAS